ncbi:MAG: energy-coupling factor transporter transmembrane component T family protein [Sphaerochaetaceae bacterium]
MVEVNFFHYRHSTSVLHKAHPLTKIVALLVCSLLLINASLLRISVMLVFLLILLLALRIPIKTYWLQMRFLAAIALLMGATRYAVSSDVLLGLLVMLRFILMIVLGIVLADSTATDELGQACARALSFLFPKRSYVVASTMELTLTLIPLLLDIALQIKEARKARLERLWPNPVPPLVSMASQFIELSLQRAQELEQALSSRGYRIDVQRGELRFSKADAIVILITTVGAWALATFS